MIGYNETVGLSRIVSSLKEDTDRTKYEVMVDNAIMENAVEGKTFTYVEKYSEAFYNTVEEQWMATGSTVPLKKWLEDTDAFAYGMTLKKYEDDGYSIEESTYGYKLSWGGCLNDERRIHDHINH